jgi:hypothetical protein
MYLSAWNASALVCSRAARSVFAASMSTGRLRRSRRDRHALIQRGNAVAQPGRSEIQPAFAGRRAVTTSEVATARCWSDGMRLRISSMRSSVNSR